MKNNKGFTLVEVLAVIVVLISIIAIISPKVISTFKTSEDTVSKEQIDSIIDVSRIYMTSNSELLPETNEHYVITLDELKESKLISNKEIINAKTQEKIQGCVLVRFKNNKYKYEYTEDETICRK